MNEIQRNEILHKKYKIVKNIGAGASSRVYKALDIIRNENVVIKMVSKKNMLLYENEVSILKQLENRYIIKYLDSFVEGDKVCLVLEYAEGGSLFNTIQRFKCIPENIAKKYVRNVLNALVEIHSKNVVHRDIKSSNILIKDGIAKIGDFGISGNINDDKFHYLEGSPYWMSPESVSSKKPTIKTDIWAVGALLIELLTGNPPFHNYPSHSVLLMLKENVIPQIPLNISPLCSSFINLCLTINPDDRPYAIDLLYHPWLKNLQELEFDYPEEYIYNLERKHYFNDISLKLLNLFINDSQNYVNAFIELNGNEILLNNCHKDKYKNCSLALIKTLASLSDKYSSLESTSKLIHELIIIIKKDENISDSFFAGVSLLLICLNKNIINYREIINLYIDHSCEKFIFPFLIIFISKTNDINIIKELLYQICLFILNFDSNNLVKLLMDVDWSSEVSPSIKNFYLKFYQNIILESIDKSLQIILFCIKMNNFIPQVVYCFENPKIINISNNISKQHKFIFEYLTSYNNFIFEKEHIDLVFKTINSQKELMEMLINYILKMIKDEIFLKEFSLTKCYHELLKYSDQYYNIFDIYLHYNQAKYLKEMEILFININSEKISKISCLMKDFPNDEIIFPSHFKCIIDYFIRIYCKNEEDYNILDSYKTIFSSSNKICSYFQENSSYQIFLNNLVKKDTKFLSSYLNIIYYIVVQQSQSNMHFNNYLFRPLLMLKRKHGDKYADLIHKIISLIY